MDATRCKQEHPNALKNVDEFFKDVLDIGE